MPKVEESRAYKAISGEAWRETPGEIQERHKARKDGTNPVKREALPATRRAAAAAGGERHGKEGQTNRRRRS